LTAAAALAHGEAFEGPGRPERRPGTPAGVRAGTPAVGYAGDAGAPEADGAAWLDRGDYTDAGVGGDDDFFYFIDGDSSLAIG
jgi:hypothetical protein